MIFRDAKLHADESIHTGVIAFLRQRGHDIVDVFQRGLAGSPDEAILAAAFAEDRIVITHDRDFGRLAILAGYPVFGIVFFRPGHIDAQFTIETIQTLDRHAIELSPPLILVAERRGFRVRFRLRNLQ